MPGNAFVRLIPPKGKPGDIKGESQQTNHVGTQGWIEISDWNWDVEAEASHLKGTGAAVGRPQPGALSFTHYYDMSSPLLMKNIVQGTHFGSLTIDMLKQVGSAEPQIYFQLIANDVFITKVSSKGGEDGSVTQDVDCVFKSLSIGYKKQKNDGTLDTTQVFVWNITESSETLASEGRRLSI